MKRKKSEVAKDFFENKISKVQCPICKASMCKEKKLLTCVKNHHFTMAKQGFFHFVNHKVKTEYDKEMLKNRRLAINSGIYDKVIEIIEEQIVSKDGVLLDAGSGEGSILNKIRAKNMQKLGIDISKDGISLATDYNTENQGFAVADLTNIPLSDNSVDVLINFLSPAMYNEFKRVLKKDGIIIKVVPNSLYLNELRQLFYKGTNKEKYKNDDVINHFEDKCTVNFKKRVTYEVSLNGELREYITKMTPLMWEANKGKINPKNLNKITIDFDILVGVFK